MSRRVLTCTVFLLTQAVAYGEDFALAGPYAPGWLETTVTRPNKSRFQSLLYYPAKAPGQNAVFEPNGAPYPGIAFGHGYLTAPDKYRSTLAHLASRGYLVMAPRSGGELFPSHRDFAGDLSHCLTWLVGQNANISSFLCGKVNTEMFGLSGHSMGGGCSILAAAADDRVKAVVNLAAANTNPSAIAAMISVRAPVSLIAGTQDAIVPVGSHGQLMYLNGATSRQLPLILGGCHCGFLDSPMIFCDSGSISGSQQLSTTRHLLTAFFELNLKKRQSSWSQVWGQAVLEDPRWSIELDAGCLLTPNRVERTGRPGTETSVILTLTNLSPYADQYDLFVEGNQWPTATSITRTGPLDPGASVDLVVHVVFPSEYAPRGDTAVVSARSGRDGATRTLARIESHIVVPGG